MKYKKFMQQVVVHSCSSSYAEGIGKRITGKASHGKKA
jgi:hypothetical protein